MVSKTEYVYALFHYADGVDKKIYFYVGRSEREPGIRFNEHRYAVRSTAKAFKTDVYQYIREKVPAQIFEEEVLCLTDDANPQDYEDFYVIKLVREGHNLMNEKHGDQKQIAALTDAYELETTGVSIKSVAELRVWREKRDFIRSEELRAKIRAQNGETPPPEHSKPMYDFMAAKSMEAIELSKIKAEKAKKRRDAKIKRESEVAALWAERSARGAM